LTKQTAANFSPKETPMTIRRLVTGHDDRGRSVVVSDGRPPWSKVFEHTPGFASTMVWRTPPKPARPHDGIDPTRAVETFVPAAAGAEHAEQSPGLVEHFERDNPGMHTTPTVDYAIVLEGEIWLELDDGQATLLKQHDITVQNATRHAWRNKSNAPAKLAFILIGAAGL
jgi:quercetin dioxygenase-like cupin family protein